MRVFPAFVRSLFALMVISSVPRVTWAADGAKDSQSSRSLVVEEATHDFGTVYQGDVIRHTFLIRKAASVPVVIREVRASCACLLGTLMVTRTGREPTPCPLGEPLEEGARLSLEVEFRTAGRQGRVDGVVTILCDGDSDGCRLLVSASIEPWFIVSPPTLEFGSIGSTQIVHGVERSCEIAQTNGAPFVAGASCEAVPRGVNYQLEPLGDTIAGTAAKWRLIVRVGTGAQEGLTTLGVVIRSKFTEDETRSTSKQVVDSRSHLVLVTARVCGVVTCDPTFISFGAICSGETTSKSIRIRSHDPKVRCDQASTRLLGPDGKDFRGEMRRYIIVTTTRVPEENGIDVEVTVNRFPRSLTGLFQGILEIDFAQSDANRIRVGVSGVCRSQ